MHEWKDQQSHYFLQYSTALLDLPGIDGTLPFIRPKNRHHNLTLQEVPQFYGQIFSNHFAEILSDTYSLPAHD